MISTKVAQLKPAKPPVVVRPIKTPAPPKPSDCGCGGHAECCELDCLVHPRFFCGQLLADQDLTALVDWIKNKSGLARFRHGWGIVCGLDVHCGPNGGVTVSPGYAMDCCGRDVIVCKEDTFDLSGCWQRPPSYCEQTATQAATTTPQGNLELGGFTVPLAQVQVFDLFIRYAETQSDARTALARGGCGGQAGCEYTRVHEAYDLYCAPANQCEDPNDPDLKKWDEDYRSALQKKFEEYRAFSALEDSKAKLRVVLDYLEENPLSSFCFVREWACDLLGQNTVSPGWENEMIFWLFQDWRMQWFGRHCPSCGPETGIRIARVWLRMTQDSRGKEKFKTLLVLGHSPFRRMLERDGDPARPGMVNLAPYLWAEANTADAELVRLGIILDRAKFNPVTLRDTIGSEVIYAHVNDRLIAHIYPDPCNRNRIVCFTRSQPAKTLPSDTEPITRGKPAPHAAAPHAAVPEDTSAPPPKGKPAVADTRDLTNIVGIGDAISGRLKAKGINDIPALAAAKPEDVRGAVADIKINPPDENELIAAAKKYLESKGPANQ
jgi:predicted flap endonuclease-1-like 5' DNA nuclease